MSWLNWTTLQVWTFDWTGNSVFQLARMWIHLCHRWNTFFVWNLCIHCSDWKLIPLWIVGLFVRSVSGFMHRSLLLVLVDKKKNPISWISSKISVDIYASDVKTSRKTEYPVDSCIPHSESLIFHAKMNKKTWDYRIKLHLKRLHGDWRPADRLRPGNITSCATEIKQKSEIKQKNKISILLWDRGIFRSEKRNI